MLNPIKKELQMTNNDFNPASEGNHISKAINHVLEQQQIEWVKKGIDIHLTYTACLIGLSQAIYDEIANFAAIKHCQKINLDISEYKNFYDNSTCVEAEEARKSVLKYGKEVIINNGTWYV
jgi:hypothetical protein